MQPAEHPTARRDPRQRSGRKVQPSTLVSVALHVVLGIVVWNALQVPAVFERLLQAERPREPVREQLQFVTIAPSSPTVVSPRAASRTPAPAGQAAPSAPALVAPLEVPSQLPPARPVESTPVVPVPGGTGAAVGPLRGGSGPTRGVQPTYDDPRIWAADPEFVYAPKNEKERLDSALIATLNRYVDSVNASSHSPNKFERGDWTFERNGQKYGIDQQFIRLGRFSIPTALLALLPLNRLQTNPIALEHDRNAAFMRADILYHAQAAMNEEQFRAAVRAIRDRKERERRQAQRNSPTSPGPVTSPGERPPPD